MRSEPETRERPTTNDRPTHGRALLFLAVFSREIPTENHAKSIDHGRGCKN